MFFLGEPMSAWVGKTLRVTATQRALHSPESVGNSSHTGTCHIGTSNTPDRMSAQAGPLLLPRYVPTLTSLH